MTRAVCGLWLGALTLSLTGCGGNGATPQATFDKFKSAWLNKDYETAMAQLTPYSQNLVISNAAIDPALLATDSTSGGLKLENGWPIPADEVTAIFEKYGKLVSITTSDRSATKSEIKRKTDCLVEFLRFREQKGLRPPTATLAQEASARLEDVKQSGDSADATIRARHDGLEETEPTKFKKVGDGWLLDLELPIGPGKT